MAELNPDRSNSHLYTTSSNSMKIHTPHKLTWNIHQDILVIKHNLNKKIEITQNKPSDKNEIKLDQ